MIKITSKGLVISDDEDLVLLRQEFSEHKCIVLPKLLADDLFIRLQKSMIKANFLPKEHLFNNKIVFGSDLSIESTSSALHMINFLLNNLAFFNLVEQFTGCGTIKGFDSRIYKNMPSSNHHLNWHDDTGHKGRLIAGSMNLGGDRFQGGVFKIREKATKKILKEVSCGNPGDMHLFMVSPLLEHCVTPTQGSYPRIAAAGWFNSEASENLRFK